MITKKKIKLALSSSIAHWERMVNFAKTQPKKEKKSSDYMGSCIGETTGAEDCALCRMFLGKKCRRCPLEAIGEKCLDEGSLYTDVMRVSTWEEWLISANEMLVVLKKLYKRA